MLADHLRAAGHDVVLTREPGGSPGAEEIRALVLQGDPDRWSAETELLLFTAARRDHMERLIQPALDAGKIVICDRFADSTRHVSGPQPRRPARRGRPIACLDDRARARPDNAHRHGSRVGLARAKGRQGTEERFEDFGAGLQAKMRAGFLALAREFPDRFEVINGARDMEVVARDVAHVADGRLASG